MNNNDLVAYICEGSAEQAIMDILFENNMLIHSNILDGEMIRTRNAKTFEEKYLRKSGIENLTIYRILDSRNENFKLSRYYKDKVKVVNVITAPEVEVLIILNEDKYNDYCNSSLKASDYCTQKLKIKNVKSYEFIYGYFSDITVLVKAINLYKSKRQIPKNEISLFELLNR